MTTIKEFIKELSSIKDSLQNKEIYFKSENGLLLEPNVKYYLKDKCSGIELTEENVDFVLIGY